MKKVIVIGLDGFEPKLVERMLDAGELPNLAQAPGAGRVLTPPYDLSGADAGGVVDVCHRHQPGRARHLRLHPARPETYLPDFSLNRYEQKTPSSRPKAVNLRRGEPLWELLSAAGIPSTILRCPCTYPPDSVRGRMLAGMGVPDLRGGLGTSTFYTSAEGESPRKRASTSCTCGADRSGTIATHLIGPRNPEDRVGLPVR